MGQVTAADRASLTNWLPFGFVEVNGEGGLTHNLGCRVVRLGCCKGTPKGNQQFLGSPNTYTPV